MRTLLLIAVQSLLLIGIADAQTAPSFPNPPTKESCAAFRAEYLAYEKALAQLAHDCMNAVNPTSEDWVPVPCSPTTWPRECAPQYEHDFCAEQQGYALLARCDAEAAAADKVKESAKEKLKESLLGEPLKRLNDLKEQVEELKTLRDEASNYQNLTDSQKLEFHRNLAEWLNAHGNSSELSRELTKIALSGTTAIDKKALAELDEELRQFDQAASTSGENGPSGNSSSIDDELNSRLSGAKSRAANSDVTNERELQHLNEFTTEGQREHQRENAEEQAREEAEAEARAAAAAREAAAERAAAEQAAAARAAAARAAAVRAPVVAPQYPPNCPEPRGFVACMHGAGCDVNEPYSERWSCCEQVICGSSP